MNEHEFERAFRAWSQAEAAEPASATLRVRVLDVPLTTRLGRGRWAWIEVGRFGSVFSATRFVVAGAIVALFGGFLLAGLLTQPSDDMAPAAVTASPSISPDLLPGVDLVTEEVEPGVYRILSDGTDNDMTVETVWDNGSAQVVAGQDDSVWVWESEWPTRKDRLIRLGQAGSYAAGLVDAWRPDLSVDRDGTVWALGEDSLLRLADGRWEEWSSPDGVRPEDIETSPDGSIWVRWTERAGSGRSGVSRVVDGDWYEDFIDPSFAGGEYAVGPGGTLAVGPDGEVLVGSTYPVEGSDGDWVAAVERGADGWTPAITVSKDESQRYFADGQGRVAIGSDGTAWAYTGVLSDTSNGLPVVTRLHRRTDGVWEELGDDGSVPVLVAGQVYDSVMTVSSDGRLWVAFGTPGVATLDGPCAGVLSYDGETWRRHLAGACANDVSADRNGNVWATVIEVAPERPDPNRPPAGIYVITPEAVVVTE